MSPYVVSLKYFFGVPQKHGPARRKENYADETEKKRATYNHETADKQLTLLELRVVRTEELEGLGHAGHARGRRPDLRGEVLEGVTHCSRNGSHEHTYIPPPRPSASDSHKAASDHGSPFFSQDGKIKQPRMTGGREGEQDDGGSERGRKQGSK